MSTKHREYTREITLGERPYQVAVVSYPFGTTIKVSRRKRDRGEWTARGVLNDYWIDAAELPVLIEALQAVYDEWQAGDDE